MAGNMEVDMFKQLFNSKLLTLNLSKIVFAGAFQGLQAVGLFTEGVSNIFEDNFLFFLRSFLSGSDGASFQSRYTIAIVHRLLFFMYRKVSRYTPEGPP